MSELTIDDLTVRFSGTTVLDGVSMRIAADRIHAVIGPNGAGKTTLVNAVTGQVRSAGARMSLGERRYLPRSPHHAARLGISRTFQHPLVFRTLTARQHVLTGAASNAEGRTNPACDALVDSLLTDIGTGSAAGLDLMGVRLTDLVRALAGTPRVLLMDEPASGLDEADRGRMLDSILRVREAGIGVLLIEHDIRLVLAVADHVTVLDDGRVAFSGAPEDVTEDRAVSRAYLGR
ncbi:ATP-binding cassette domain-containing protein [Actinomadura sp. KC216]|uniref:ABC transporter ATP-binding protein n=1 Tax=Actinomadura sp. KC216 TaxID=2530370 RepID=UPI00104DD547|nr:ATP-binding cassette domain-containing protein [Actinomadura sp. KC216]TDB90631.1 ATP-binding cassette domain-containing protein [Actinomadura sp. KC216]